MKSQQMNKLVSCTPDVVYVQSGLTFSGASANKGIMTASIKPGTTPKALNTSSAPLLCRKKVLI